VLAGSSTSVTPQMRERAKRVTYGIVYGLSAFGLAQQLSEQGVTKESAQQMINSFLSRFAGCPLTPCPLALSTAVFHTHMLDLASLCAAVIAVPSASLTVPAGD